MFADALETVIAIRQPGWKSGAQRAGRWRASLRRHAFPRIGRKRVDAITPADVMAVLAPIRTTTPRTARRVRQRIAAVMQWAVAEGYRDDNPAGDAVVAALPGVKVRPTHRRALPYAEVAAAVAAVRGCARAFAARLGFEFTVLCAVRSGEARLARWEDIDLDAATWTIPAAAMKSNRAHRVPLSDRAVAVLGEAGAGRAGWVFPSPVTGGAFADNWLRLLLTALGIAATPHGFRSSFRDWAAENTDAPRAVMEAALAARHPRRHRGRLRALGPVRAPPHAHAAVGRLSGRERPVNRLTGGVRAHGQAHRPAPALRRRQWSVPARQARSPWRRQVLGAAPRDQRHAARSRPRQRRAGHPGRGARGCPRQPAPGPAPGPTPGPSGGASRRRSPKPRRRSSPCTARAGKPGGGSEAQWCSTFERYAYPRIGRKPVHAIDAADLMAVLAPLWIEKHETARRLRLRIGQVMKWAIGQGHRSDNPAGDAVGAALSKVEARPVHQRALPHAEVGAALGAVRRTGAAPAAKLAFEFMVLCAVRSGEARGAAWDEIDLDRAVWTLPAARMKAGREHRVPLSPRALGVLREAAALRRGELVFPAPSTGRALTVAALGDVLRAAGVDAVPHGFRSSFRDWAAECTDAPARSVRARACARQLRSRGSGLPAQRPVRPASGADERLGRVRRLTDCAAGAGAGAARAPGSAGRAQRGLRQCSRGVAGVVWPEAGRGSDTPRPASGVFGFGPAAFSCPASRSEPPAPPGPRSSSRSGLPDSCPARSRPALRSRDFPPHRSPDSHSIASEVRVR